MFQIISRTKVVFLSLLMAFVLSERSAAFAQLPASPLVPIEAGDSLTRKASDAVRKSAIAFAKDASTHGGYVYRVSLDRKIRMGEGFAAETEIWVQPPGTPTVGSALLRAYQITGEPAILEAAIEAAEALMHGQLESGGWSDRVNFDPKAKSTGFYRKGSGNPKGRNVSTLDDDKTQSAIRFLTQMDDALDGKNRELHEAVLLSLDSLLSAQFANGGFPQGWDRPVEKHPVSKASFPAYDWRTEGRLKDYWNYETLNDGLAGTVSETLWLAWDTYRDSRYRDALLRFGDFLIQAQLPEPQPGWAQQYNHDLVPIWARKFEPPAVSGRESEDVIETLLFLAGKTEESRFLRPVPAAIEWLKRSRLSDGQIARFYELKTNKPLYFFRRGDIYTLTYADSDLPTHYSFKSKPRYEKLAKRYEQLVVGNLHTEDKSMSSLRKETEAIIATMSETGHWYTDADGKPLNNSLKRPASEVFLDSALFSKNIERLSEFINMASGAQIK